MSKADIVLFQTSLYFLPCPREKEFTLVGSKIAYHIQYLPKFSDKMIISPNWI